MSEMPESEAVATGLTREQELAALKPLARRFPTPDAALAEIARLSAQLTLPKGVVHVVSDVHGEDLKLRHIINNASGTLRRSTPPRRRTSTCSGTCGAARSRRSSARTASRRWSAT